ncbi:hypothetical protein IP84_09485 [beta proteobacterium AAP99]|nr:hypothetical protein IP84_09485 [beta proteobacterium AAP99]
MPAQVKCPSCGTKVLWNETAQWRPFCSERCKLVDLGAWASDKYRIAGAEPRDSTDLDEPDAVGQDTKRSQPH